MNDLNHMHTRMRSRTHTHTYASTRVHSRLSFPDTLTCIYTDYALIISHVDDIRLYHKRIRSLSLSHTHAHAHAHNSLPLTHSLPSKQITNSLLEKEIRLKVGRLMSCTHAHSRTHARSCVSLASSFLPHRCLSAAFWKSSDSQLVD